MNKYFSSVSIGMPVYNGGNYIHDAISSILSQSFQDFELIISDNASTDNTENICLEFADKDKRIKYIKHPQNLGAAENFRYALRASKSPFFMWAACDDLWANDFIETCYNLLQDDKNAMFAMTGYQSRSRILKGFFRKNFDNYLSCISLKESEQRLIKYTSLPFNTQKDNLVYSLWRTDFISNSLEELYQNKKLNNFLGAAMNEYILLKAHGAYAEDIKFFKLYKKVPPGHWLSGFFSLAHKLKMGLFPTFKVNKASYGIDEFLTDLGIVLDMANIVDETKCLVLERNRFHLNQLK